LPLVPHPEKTGYTNVNFGVPVGENDIYWGRVYGGETAIRQLKDSVREITLVSFRNTDTKLPLELKIGFSFVSIENAKMNLEKEMIHKNFDQVKNEANETWNKLLSKIIVEGGTDRHFFTTIMRRFSWPVRICGD